jgi:osmotically-inducible protein OsmY
MKNTFLLFAAASAMLTCSTSLQASDIDRRIESSAAKSYVYKIYLTNDSIKTESKNGIVTLTGAVSDTKDRLLAQDTVESLPGVFSMIACFRAPPLWPVGDDAAPRR